MPDAIRSSIRMRPSLGGGPALRIARAAHAPRHAPRGGRGRPAARRAGAARGRGRSSSAENVRAAARTRSPRARPARRGARRAARAMSARLPSTWPRRSVNGRAVAREREPHVELVDAVERGEELADRVRAEAAVEVERDPPEHVVAGDQEPPLGEVQDDVRRRVAGRLDHLPGAEVRLHLDAVDEVARGHQRAAHPGVRAALALRPRLQRRLRDAALRARPRAGAAGWPRGRRAASSGARGAGGSRARSPCAPAAPHACAAVVDVGVRADEQADVLDLPADLRRAPARGRASSPRPSKPQSNSTIPSPAASAQALQCGTPGHGSGSRSRQTPGITRSPAPHLRPPRRLAHRADANVARHGRRRTLRRRDLLRGTRRARDVEAAAACWAPDGVDNMVGQTTLDGPEGVRAFFGELFAAMPDFAFAVESVTAEEDRVAVRWSATGTFAGTGSFQGIAPTGQRVELTGLDLLHVRDGMLVHNDAFTDGLGLARQLGHDAAAGLAHRHRDAAARSTPRRAGRGGSRDGAPSRWPTASGASAAACRGAMNVYLIEDDGGGVTVFDAGVRGMGRRDRRRRERARRDQPRRARPRPRRPPRRGAGLGACRSSAIPTSARTRRATAGSHYVRLRPAAAARAGRLPAAVQALGRRAGRDRRDGRGGRRRQRLPRRAPARPRARPDRAVPRARRRGADHRRLLHARHPDRPAARSRRPRTPRSSRTSSRPAPRSASSPSSAPSAAWPGHAEPLTGDVAAQLGGPPRRADGQAQPPPRAPRRSPRRSPSTPRRAATCWCCAAR